mmetsp:Transcript_46287/g.67929  ORF Transcript_46287/g.67929 Transcript_46287/m.67929 type:complete len:92 (+) Transcript_46287:1717-1992(+)
MSRRSMYGLTARNATTVLHETVLHQIKKQVRRPAKDLRRHRERPLSRWNDDSATHSTCLDGLLIEAQPALVAKAECRITRPSCITIPRSVH